MANPTCIIKEANTTLLIGETDTGNFGLMAVQNGEVTDVELNRFQAIRLYESVKKYLGYD